MSIRRKISSSTYATSPRMSHVSDYIQTQRNSAKYLDFTLRPPPTESELAMMTPADATVESRWESRGNDVEMSQAIENNHMNALETPEIKEEVFSQPVQKITESFKGKESKQEVKQTKSSKFIKLPSEPPKPVEKVIHTHTKIVNKILNDEEREFALCWDYLLHYTCQLLLERTHLMSTLVFYRAAQTPTTGDLEKLNHVSQIIPHLLPALEKLSDTFSIPPSTMRFFTQANHPGIIEDVQKHFSKCRYRYWLLEFLNLMTNPFEQDDTPSLIPRLNSWGWSRVLPHWLKLTNLEVDELSTGQELVKLETNWWKLTGNLAAQAAYRYVLCLIEEDENHSWTMQDLREALNKCFVEPFEDASSNLPCLMEAMTTSKYERVLNRYKDGIEVFLKALLPFLDNNSKVSNIGQLKVPPQVIKTLLLERLNTDVERFVNGTYEKQQWLGSRPKSYNVYSLHETFFELIFRQIQTLALGLGLDVPCILKGNTWTVLKDQAHDNNTQKEPLLLSIARNDVLSEYLNQGFTAPSISKEDERKSQKAHRAVSGNASFWKFIE